MLFKMLYPKTSSPSGSGIARPSVLAIAVLLLFCFTSVCFGQNAITSNLPILVINSGGVVIPNADKIPAKLQIVKSDVNGNYSYDISNPPTSFDVETDIGIEIRGNSSIFWDKKAWGVEIRVSPTGDSKDLALLGMAAESDWVLNASYGDKSFMRDALAHEMYRKTGRYSPRSKYVELFVKQDGAMTYVGVYMLMEKIKKADARINVKKLSETDSDPAKITGGYILQIGEDEDVKWSSTFPPSDSPTKPSPIFHVEYPKLHKYTNQANKTLQLNYIKGFITSFETALYGNDYKSATLGYRKYIDVDAMVDYLLHEEFTKNVDNWRISTFLYKNRDSDGGLLTMGAPWDFDRSMGNQQWCFEPSVLPTGTWSWQYNLNCPDRPAMTVSWPKRLLSDCYFKEKLMQRYISLRQNEWSDQSIINFIAAQKTILTTEINAQQTGVDKSPMQRNFKKWNILSTAVMNNDHYTLAGNTYDKEVQYLQEWLIAHLAWMDQNIQSISSTSCAALPVTFSNFDVKLQESGVLVSWSTASEQNNDHFEVERSGEAKTFSSLGVVKGNGNSNAISKYQFTDNAPLPGMNYYRIRQVDLDGSVSYSTMRAIENRNAVSVLYPNPGKDEVNIRNVVSGSVITIADKNGRTIKTLKATQKEINIPVAEFGSGIYEVSVFDNASGFLSRHKLVIAK